MIQVTGNIGSFTISWDPLTVPDISGYVVCGVPGTEDFAVSASNILNVGPETSFTYYPSTSGFFSVKVAGYDSFSNPKALILSDLNFSSLQTVEVLGLTTEVLSALQGQLTDSQLHQDLSARINLIDLPTTGLVDKLVQEIADRGAAITGEANARANALTYYYTKTEADSATSSAITGATSSLVSNSSLATSLSSYYTKVAADEATSTAITGATSSLVTNSSLATSLSSYYTKTAADAATATAITGATSSLVSNSSLATSLSSYYTKTAADAAIADYVNNTSTTIQGLVTSASIESRVRASTTGPDWDPAVVYSKGKVVLYGFEHLFQRIDASGGTPVPSVVDGVAQATAYWKPVTANLYAETMLKTDVNGHVVGIGLANDGVTGEVEILADKFKVVNPSLPTQAQQVFTVGSINGVSGQVGINGNLVIDGSIQARSIATNELIVGDNIAMGPNAVIEWVKVGNRPTDLAGLDSTAATKLVGIQAGATVGADWNTNLANKPTIPTVPAYITSTKITSTTIESPTITAGTFTGSQFILGNGTTYGKLETYDFANKPAGIQIQDGATPTLTVKGGTFTGSTFQTAESGQRVLISSASNSILFYGSDEGVKAGIGTLTLDGVNTYSQFGTVATGDSRIGLVAYAYNNDALYSYTINGSGVRSTSENGYGVIAESRGARAPLKLIPRSQPTSGFAGDVYFDSSLNRLRYHNGTNWVSL